jgi:hypothetical protein
MQPRDGSAAVREIIGNGTEVLPRLRPLTAAEFLRLDLPPRALLLDPWLPTQGLAMIHSVRGIGKTYLALGIAYAVSAGGGLLGWRAPMPRRVLYLDGEMPAAAMRRRLAAIIAGYDGEPPALDYLRLLTADIIDGGLPDLGTEAGQAEIDAAIGDAELIVVDNISTLVRSGKENEAESWLPVQGWASARRAQRVVCPPRRQGRATTGNLATRGRARHGDPVASAAGLHGGSGCALRDRIHEGPRPLWRRCPADRGALRRARRAGIWTRAEVSDTELMRVVEALKGACRSARWRPNSACTNRESSGSRRRPSRGSSSMSEMHPDQSVAADARGSVSVSRPLASETPRHLPSSRDGTETPAETTDLKALAFLVLARDTQQDSNGDRVSRGTRATETPADSPFWSLVGLRGARQQARRLLPGPPLTVLEIKFLRVSRCLGYQGTRHPRRPGKTRSRS